MPKMKLGRLLTIFLIVCMFNIVLISTATAGNDPKRLSGEGREATAYSIATELYPSGTDYAIVTEYLKLADSMAATLLAKAYDAPVFPVYPADWSWNKVITYLNNLKVKNIIIVGGTAAVNEETENAFKAAGFYITRIEGNDRNLTSVKMIKQAIEKGLAIGSTLYVANGLQIDPPETKKGYAPGYALIPSADVYKNYNPVITIDYYKKAGEIDSLLNELVAAGYSNPQKIIVLGDINQVTNIAVERMQNKFGNIVERVDGNNEYQVSARFCNTFLIGQVNNLILARGDDFADGLAGGLLAGAKNAALLFVQTESIPEDVIDSVNKIMSANQNCQTYVLGGTNAVGEKVIDEITDFRVIDIE